MASVEMTKKQRENSKKSGRAAADKEEAERERLDRLANHRRELDRARLVFSVSQVMISGKMTNFSCISNRF